MATINKDLKIEIRPIPNRRGIRDFSEELEYFSQAHIISPLVNPDTLKYKTGLSKEDLEYLKDLGFPYDVSNNYIKGVSHPFWESAGVKVELLNTPIFLYPGRNEMDFIKYRWLLESKFVYSSEQEIIEGGKSEATHFIYDEGEEIAAKASKIDERNRIALKVDKLSKQKKKEFILILLNENTDNKDEDYLTVRFEDILSNKNLYAELTELLDAKQEYVSMKAEVKTAIQKNVLKRTKFGIFFFDTNLGYSEDDVIEQLSKPENQELYLQIKTKIK